MRFIRCTTALALVAGATLLSPAQAQDATWLATPVDPNVLNPNNWNPAVVPAFPGTAFFDASALTFLINPGGAWTVAAITLNAGASDYTLLNAPGGTLTLLGPGITINGGSLTLINDSTLRFFGGATAGSATILNNLTLDFLAGSSAGSANITNNALLTFNDSTAGAATITNFGNVQFTGGLASGGSARFILNAGLLDFSGVVAAIMTVGSIEGIGAINLGTVRLVIGGNNLSTTHSGPIFGAGGIEKVGTGTLTLTGINTYASGTTITGGTLAIGNMSALSTGDVQLNGGTLRSEVTGTLANDIVVNSGASGTIVAANGQTLTISGTVAVQSNAAALRFGEAGGTGVVDVASNTASAGFPLVYTVDVLGGTVRATGGTLGFHTSVAAATNVAAGATLEYLHSLTAGVNNLQSAGTVTIGAGFDLRAGGGLSTGVVGGAGGLTVAAPGTLNGNTGLVVLAGANTYAGGTIIETGATLQLGAGGATGSILGNVANSGTLAFNRSNTYAFDGVISGAGAVQQIGAGTTIFTAAHSYTGGTTVTNGVLQVDGAGTLGTGAVAVTGGALLVNGSIAAAAGLTVGPGGTVGGTGTLPSSLINGTLAPGNNALGTINIAGNLTFGGTGVYVVEVGTTTADRTNVTGTASLAGTVRAVPVGQPLAFGTRYTILNAAGGVTGTFSSVQSLLGAAFNPVLSYDANNVFLTLNAAALAPTLSGLTANQQAVVNGLDRGIAAGGNANPFLPLFLLSPSGLATALDQLSGEVHTGTQGLGVLVSGQFLQAMLDQNAFGRTPRGVLAYGPSGALAGLPGVVAATQAADLPAEVEVIDTRRFAVWGAVFGSDGRIGGDVVIGSARRHERNFGLAAGVDVRVAPGTIVGVALAGGGADASVSGRGSLEADVFQAGLYALTRFGFLDLRAALAYSHLDVDSSRSIPVLGIPTLTANYEAEVWSGRLEAAVPLTAFAGLSIAPVAALQVQSVRIDGFTETTPGGPVAAALTVAGRTSTTSRGELGLRFETRFGAPGFDATAFARLAWAHYFERASDVTAAFVGLAGSNFTVIGARPDRDSALISAGIDVRVTPQLSIGARFDGEFSENVNQYAGTARIRFEF